MAVRYRTLYIVQARGGYVFENIPIIGHLYVVSITWHHFEPAACSLENYVDFHITETLLQYQPHVTLYVTC